MKLFEVDSTSQYWVVRAGKKAKFYNHFIQSKCVALAHMDAVKFSKFGEVNSDDIEKIEKDIKKYNDSLQEPEDYRQIASRIGQVRHFINDLQIGDTVFTLSKAQIAIGTITSKPYVSKDMMAYISDKGETIKAGDKFILRRDVHWENFKLRSTLPQPIISSIGSQKTLFSLEAHNELLKHWLYGAYLEDGLLHFTTEIAQRHDIEHFHLVEFQRIVQIIELFSILPSVNEATLENEVLQEAYYRYGGKGKFSLTNKSIYTSPGNSWGKMLAGKLQAAFFMAVLSGCMGEPYTSQDEEVNDYLNKRKGEIELVVDHIKYNTSIDLHQERLQASLSKPNKSTFTVNEDDIKDLPKAEVKVQENEEAENNNTDNEKGSGDGFEDFPEISEDGDTGV